MLQPGDVLVVDLFGKKEGGTIVGDNLFYYIMKATKGGGLVVDGAIRDLEGISEMDMPAYFRSSHPSAIANVMLTGINIPVRIGNVTVMPGDLVVGDQEGVYFIPPQFAQEIMDKADDVHVHDEWTRKKFDEGKYKSSEIYSSPRDPELRKEYQEYLKKRLERNPQEVALLEIAAEVLEGALEVRDIPLQRGDALAVGWAALRRRGLRLFGHLDIAGQQLRPALFLVACLAGQFLDESNLRQSV